MGAAGECGGWVVASLRGHGGGVDGEDNDAAPYKWARKPSCNLLRASGEWGTHALGCGVLHRREMEVVSSATRGQPANHRPTGSVTALRLTDPCATGTCRLGTRCACCVGLGQAAHGRTRLDSTVTRVPVWPLARCVGLQEEPLAWRSVPCAAHQLQRLSIRGGRVLDVLVVMSSAA